MGFARLLDKNATHLRASIAQSDAGDEVQTWVTVATGVRCAVQLASGARRTEDGGYVQVERWLGLFNPGSDIRNGDRIVAGGITYTVDAVDSPRGHHIEANMRQTVAPEG